MNRPPPIKRVIVVTGASAGVGRAAVRAFAREGAKIGLLARGRDGLEAARGEIEKLRGIGLVVPVDVADAARVEAAAAEVEQKLGPIDVWVNNAMVSVFSPVKDTTAEEFRRVSEVTYLGYDSQQLDAPEDPNRPNNLWEPVRLGRSMNEQSAGVSSGGFQNIATLATALARLRMAAGLAAPQLNHNRKDQNENRSENHAPDCRRICLGARIASSSAQITEPITGAARLHAVDAEHDGPVREAVRRDYAAVRRSDGETA